MRSKHSVGTHQGNKLTCNSSGSTWPLSSQLAEPLWTDPSLKSGIGVHELISTLKAKAGIDSSNLPPKYSHERKIPPPPCHYECPVLFKFNRCSCFTYVFFSFVFRMVWLSYVHQVTMQRRTKPCKLARWKMIGTVGSC